MNNDAVARLKHAIDKFNEGRYEVKEFHSSIESIIHSITETELEELREKLLKFESELEYIDFMVDAKNRRNSYLIKINELNKWLLSYYLR